MPTTNKTTPIKTKLVKKSAIGASPALNVSDDNLSTTARHILDVSEKLFAKHGLEGVSARDIVTASGQRNISAVSYHFGTREGMLGVLLSRRMRVLNQRREERLTALEKAGRANDVHAVIGTSFGVLSDVVRDESWGPNFVAILAQVFFHPELDFPKLVGLELLTGNEKAKQMTRKALPDLPAKIFLSRAEMAYYQGTFALAQWVHKNGPVTPENAPLFDAQMRNTVDFLTAGVMAPIAPKSAHARK
jgi:AcrR family transcriptional regulator